MAEAAGWMARRGWRAGSGWGPWLDRLSTHGAALGMGDGRLAAREGTRDRKQERRTASGRKRRGWRGKEMEKRGARRVAGIWTKGCEAYSDSVHFLRTSGKWGRRSERRAVRGEKWARRGRVREGETGAGVGSPGSDGGRVPVMGDGGGDGDAINAISACVAGSAGMAGG